MNKPERLAPGHRMCAGCGGTIAVRNVLVVIHEGDKAVIGNATGCLEVSTFTYPSQHGKTATFTMHLKNAGATLSGVEGALQSVKEKREITGYKLQIYYIWWRRRYIRYRTSVIIRGNGANQDLVLCATITSLHETQVSCVLLQHTMYAIQQQTPVGARAMVNRRTEKIWHHVIAAHDIPYVALN